MTLTLVAAALMIAAAPARAGSCATVELFVYNLTNNQITATWVDQAGNETAQAVDGQNVIYLGQQCINVSKEQPFQLSIQDPGDGIVNAEYTIDAENCYPENWIDALSNFPSDCWDINGQFMPGPVSYYIVSDHQDICLRGPASAPSTLSPNGALGVASLNHSCPSRTPSFSVRFNNYSGQRFSWPIALGTYAPTSGQGLTAQPVLPGLSPSGVTPCLGTVCVIPSHDSDFNYWPVTIYWLAGDGGTPGFTYNGDTSFSLDGSYSGVNIPSHLSNYEEDGTDDVYLPPSSTIMQGFPAPCWPTFDSAGNLTNCAATASNAPAYVPNPKARSGLAQSVLRITSDVVSALVDIITIGGVF